MCGRGEAVVRGGGTRVERRWQDAMGGVRGFHVGSNSLGRVDGWVVGG